MEVGGPSGIPAPGADCAAEPPPPVKRSGSTRPLRARDIQLYGLCEDLTEALIYCMIVFGPWAFGTTEPWSIWLMTGAGCLSGLLLACKLAIRRLKGCRPARWDAPSLESFSRSAHLRPSTPPGSPPRSPG